MHSSQYPEFRERLEQGAAELMAILRARQGITVERLPDAVDEWAHAAERELGALALQSTSERLRQVQAALRRIQDGTYGVCARCEEEIPLRRLRAVPWAALCVRCQEKEDAARTRQPFAEAA